LVLEGSGALRVVDWSFCCRQSANQVAVATPGYTAPEQESGRAECASDWYSLGATCFALANGFTLDERGPAAFARGLKQIELGTTEFRGWDVEEYFTGLLKRDSLARPKPWESKRELFNIRRNSGAVRHSVPAEQRATPGAALAWLGRVIRSIGGR
jgi:serine/threonine protein kinase